MASPRTGPWLTVGPRDKQARYSRISLRQFFQYLLPPASCCFHLCSQTLARVNEHLSIWTQELSLTTAPELDVLPTWETMNEAVSPNSPQVSEHKSHLLVP